LLRTPASPWATFTGGGTSWTFFGTAPATNPCELYGLAACATAGGSSFWPRFTGGGTSWTFFGTALATTPFELYGLAPGVTLFSASCAGGGTSWTFGPVPATPCEL
jgi:hypothetical protein